VQCFVLEEALWGPAEKGAARWKLEQQLEQLTSGKPQQQQPRQQQQQQYRVSLCVHFNQVPQKPGAGVLRKAAVAEREYARQVPG